jgi:hypothetical protein
LKIAPGSITVCPAEIRILAIYFKLYRIIIAFQKIIY